MNRLSLLSLSSLLLPLLSACLATPDPVRSTDRDTAELQGKIDVSAALDGASIQGVSLVNGTPGLFDLIVPGRGIVRVDRAGAVVAEHRIGSDGLEDRGYNDVASLAQGQFVLLSNQEGFLYDPATGVLSVHFCVVPEMGPEEGEPVESVLVQRNDAVAVAGSLILAAPRFYSFDENGNEALVSSELRTYQAGDGTQLSVVDMGDASLELTGIAQAGDAIVGVWNDELVTFSLDGELRSRARLPGVTAASGVAVDLGAREIIVSDAADGVLSVFKL